MSDCIVRTTNMQTNGYSKVYIRFENGKNVYQMAHRNAFEKAYGKIPEGMCVLHRCDVRNCINPDHLFLGTQQDNMRDKFEKNRQAGGIEHGEKVRARAKLGTDCAHVKLTEAQVLEIYNLRTSRRYEDRNCAVGERFGVSKTTVCHIQSGKTWTSVTKHCERNLPRTKGVANPKPRPFKKPSK